MNKLQPAVKKETLNIIVYTVIGLVVMLASFFVGHLFYEETVPFDYTVFTGGICGSFVAVLNFFLMAVTVQKVAATEDESAAKNIFKISYSRRMLMQIVWMVVAIVTPVFHWVAGILPLLFPTLGIKIKGSFIFFDLKNRLIKKKKENKDGN